MKFVINQYHFIQITFSDVILNLPYNTTIEGSAEVGQPIYSIVVKDLAGYSAANITDLKNPSDYFMIENSK